MPTKPSTEPFDCYPVKIWQVVKLIRSFGLEISSNYLQPLKETSDYNEKDTS